MLDALVAVGVSAWLGCQQQEGPTLETELASIAEGWDEARYEITDENSQVVALGVLATEAELLAQRYPNDIRVRIWQGVILIGEADDAGWIDALRYAGQANELLLAAERQPLDGSTSIMVETALGVLYGQAPPFPISFGDGRIAEAHFRRALVGDPTGVEANFYYADFLVREHRERDAIAPLQRALLAPSRPGREIGDQALHQQAQRLLTEVRHRTRS